MSFSMTTSVSQLMPYILPQVPTVPLPYAEFQARLAVIEFCERTRCWRQVFKKTISSQNGCDLATINSTIHEFEEATLNGNVLTPTQFTDVDPDELTGETNTGTAKYITQIKPGTVSVYPFEAGVLRVSCFLKPRHGQAIGLDEEDPLADAYNVLPEFMVTQYAEKLAHGALWRIMSTNKQDFTDPQMAGVHKAAFDDACNKHFASNMRGQQRAPIRVKPRWM
jgi:hypothetical protein